MQKLSTDEFEQLSIRGKGRSTPIFNSIINLKVGEALLIESKDWKRKAGPSTLVRYIEKMHNRKYTCGAVEGGRGWAIKRLESDYKVIEPPVALTQSSEVDRLKMKSDLVVFYLGRMAFQKIERIEDSIKAAVNHFFKVDPLLLKELFYEIIKSLEDQGHIVIENEKTYIPLRKSN